MTGQNEIFDKQITTPPSIFSKNSSILVGQGFAFRGGPVYGSFNFLTKVNTESKKEKFCEKSDKFFHHIIKINFQSSLVAPNDLLTKVLRTINEVIGKIMLQIVVSHNM